MDRRQRRFLVCRQPPRRVALRTIAKTLQSLRIVANHRVGSGTPAIDFEAWIEDWGDVLDWGPESPELAP